MNDRLPVREICGYIQHFVLAKSDNERRASGSEFVNCLLIPTQITFSLQTIFAPSVITATLRDYSNLSRIIGDRGQDHHLCVVLQSDQVALVCTQTIQMANVNDTKLTKEQRPRKKARTWKTLLRFLICEVFGVGPAQRAKNQRLRVRAEKYLKMVANNCSLVSVHPPLLNAAI